MIAVELVSNPSLIFLDEPLDGIDQKSAKIVTRVLKSLAKKGRTIIQTASFPSSDTWEKTDKLLLLMKGKVIFNDSKDRALPYFQKLGFTCPDYSSVSDHLLKITVTPASFEELDATRFEDTERSLL